MSSLAGLGLLLLLVTCKVEAGQPVKEDCDFVGVQTRCKEVNNALTEATDKKDAMNTCIYVFKILHCAAANSPDCLDLMIDAMSVYQGTPYQCTLSSENIQILQSTKEAAYNTRNSTSYVTQSTPGRGTTAQREIAEIRTNESRPKNPRVDNAAVGAGGSKEKHQGDDDNAKGEASTTVSSSTLNVLLLVALFVTMTTRR